MRCICDNNEYSLHPNYINFYTNHSSISNIELPVKDDYTPVLNTFQADQPFRVYVKNKGTKIFMISLYRGRQPFGGPYTGQVGDIYYFYPDNSEYILGINQPGIYTIRHNCLHSEAEDTYCDGIVRIEYI